MAQIVSQCERTVFSVPATAATDRNHSAMIQVSNDSILANRAASYPSIKNTLIDNQNRLTTNKVCMDNKKMDKSTILPLPQTLFRKAAQVSNSNAVQNQKLIPDLPKYGRTRPKVYPTKWSLSTRINSISLPRMKRQKAGFCHSINELCGNVCDCNETGDGEVIVPNAIFHPYSAEMRRRL